VREIDGRGDLFVLLFIIELAGFSAPSFLERTERIGETFDMGLFLEIVATPFRILCRYTSGERGAATATRGKMKVSDLLKETAWQGLWTSLIAVFLVDV
jgi:hypothetical protein